MFFSFPKFPSSLYCLLCSSFLEQDISVIRVFSNLEYVHVLTAARFAADIVDMQQRINRPMNQTTARVRFGWPLAHVYRLTRALLGIQLSVGLVTLTGELIATWTTQHPSSVAGLATCMSILSSGTKECICNLMVLFPGIRRAQVKSLGLQGQCGGDAGTAGATGMGEMRDHEAGGDPHREAFNRLGSIIDFQAQQQVKVLFYRGFPRALSYCTRRQ